jgi:hypothetical protein
MAILFEQIDENDKYKNGVRLEEYNGNYSIIVVQAGSEKIWAKWCYPQRRVNGQNVPAEKSIPMGVSLGTRADAIFLLTEMLAAFDSAGPEKKQTSGLPPIAKTQPFQKLDVENDDIPF